MKLNSTRELPLENFLLTYGLLCPILPYNPLKFLKEVANKVSDEILTIKEVAAYLKVAEKTIYRLAGSKKLPGFKVGGIWRFKKSEIEHWINTRSAEMLDDKGSEDEKSE